jgi:plastocyanin
MTVRRGESVVFVNDDTVPHNVVSASGGNGFDLGQQPPNHATPVTFTLQHTAG